MLRKSLLSIICKCLDPATTRLFNSTGCLYDAEMSYRCLMTLKRRRVHSIISQEKFTIDMFNTK